MEVGGFGGIVAVPGVISLRWKYDHVGLRKVDWCIMCSFFFSPFSASLFRFRFSVFG